MFRKIKTACVALYQWLVWRKCKRVDKLTREYRLSICVTCPEFRYVMGGPNWMKYKCHHCGCYLKLKTWCIDQKCNLEKW